MKLSQIRLSIFLIRSQLLFLWRLPGLQVAVHVVAPRDAQRHAIQLPVDEHPRLHFVARAALPYNDIMGLLHRNQRAQLRHCKILRLGLTGTNGARAKPQKQQPVECQLLNRVPSASTILDPRKWDRTAASCCAP